jgi:hypothetical protein
VTESQEPVDRGDGRSPADGPRFVLRSTATVDDLEKIVRARRRATGAVWLDRLSGVVYLALGLLMVSGTLWGDTGAVGVVLGVAVLVLSVAFLSGLWGRWYRRAFTWRSNPALFRPTEDTVDASGIRSVSDGQVQEFAWSHWTSVLELPEHLVVATSPRGNATVNVLTRRGLDDPQRWDELVRFVRDRVGQR